MATSPLRKTIESEGKKIVEEIERIKRLPKPLPIRTTASLRRLAKRHKELVTALKTLKKAGF